MEIEEDRDFYPIMYNVKTHELCVEIIPFDIKIKGFSDLIESPPHKSICGNLYVMVVCDFGSNTILAELIKNRQAATISDAFIKMHIILKSI